MVAIIVEPSLGEPRGVGRSRELALTTLQLIHSSANVLLLISAVKNNYTVAPGTLKALLPQCGPVYRILSRIQARVHKDGTSMTSELATHGMLREAIDGAITGYRMTLSALSFELEKLEKLIEPKPGLSLTELIFQAEAKQV